MSSSGKLKLAVRCADKGDDVSGRYQPASTSLVDNFGVRCVLNMGGALAESATAVPIECGARKVDITVAINSPLQQYQRIFVSY